MSVAAPSSSLPVDGTHRPEAAGAGPVLQAERVTSIVGSLLFWGYGLSLFGRIDRAWLMAVWFGMSLLQVAFSVWWLRYFRFGPLEWAWRSLVWWRMQPLRRGT
jgi:hypothetical protein